MSNIYYNPEQFGLEIVGEIEWEEPCYSFDTTVIWRDPEVGTICAASDSGCSCPTPFEGLGRQDLTRLDTPQAVIDYLNERNHEGNDYADAQIGPLVMKVRDLMRSPTP